MFGAEFEELILFLKQLGVAVAGAAALWGAYFAYKEKKEAHGDKCIIYHWLTLRLFIPLYGGLFLAAISWVVLYFLIPVEAHEGIVLIPSAAERIEALALTTPIFIFWLLFAAGGFFLGKLKKNSSYIFSFLIINLLFAIVIASLPAWSGEFSERQWFFIGHNVHSIFTLGTVLMLDFLFLISKSSSILKQHVFPAFPTISKVIWVGLAFDFLSVTLVFEEAINLSDKFFFMQTLIGILIVNGVILSGPLTRKLLESVKEGGKALTSRLTAIADLCGTVSITSWATITLLDFFEHLTLSYYELLTFYVGIIAVLYIGHFLWETFFPNRLVAV
jgi:hypothetical protein